MTVTPPAPVIRHAGEGDHVWGMRACQTVKLAADAVEDRRVSAMEVLAPTEFGPPLHIHHEEDEILQILEGTVRVVCGNTDIVLGEGGFAFLPRAVPHTFLVLDGPARMLTIFTPGGVEAMFADSGTRTERAELPPPGAVPDGALGALLGRHNVEMVGPPLVA